MKKITGFVAFICLLLQAQFVVAQTQAEIINKHIAAMGGREKIISLSTAFMTGTFVAIGDTAVIKLTATKKHMIGSRMDIEANNTNNYQLITQKEGLIYTPVMGDKAPRPLTPDMFKAGQVQLDLHGPFVNSSEKGYKIAMAGKDTVNGLICHILKVTAPNTNVTDYYIDSNSGLIVQTSTKMFQFGAMEDVITTYSEYRKNEDGFWFPYVNDTPRGKTTYDKIVANQPVDVNIFKAN